MLKKKQDTESSNEQEFQWVQRDFMTDMNEVTSNQKMEELCVEFSD